MINRTESENRQLLQEAIISTVMCIRSIEKLRLVFIAALQFDRDPIITEEREQKITDFVRGFEA